MECGARRRRFGPFPTAINARRANPGPQLIRPESFASSQRQRVKSGARGRRSPKTDLGVFRNLECGARRRRFGPFPTAINARRANPGPQLIRPEPTASSQRQRVKSGARGHRSPKTDLGVFPHLECGARRRRFRPFPAAINAHPANPRPQVIRPEPFASSRRQRVESGARGRRSPKTDPCVFPHLECGARRRRFGPFSAAINARRANLGPQVIRPDPFASSQRQRVESGALGRRSPKTDLRVFPHLECGARRRRFSPFPAAINAQRANPGPQLIRPESFASSQRQRVKAASVGAAVQKPHPCVFPHLECGARRRRFGPFPIAINARRANPGPQLIRPEPYASRQRSRVKAAPVGAAVQKPTWAYSPIWSAAPAGAALARSPQRSTPAPLIPVPS